MRNNGEGPGARGTVPNAGEMAGKGEPFAGSLPDIADRTEAGALRVVLDRAQQHSL